MEKKSKKVITVRLTEDKIIELWSATGILLHGTFETLADRLYVYKQLFEDDQSWYHARNTIEDFHYLLENKLPDDFAKEMV